MDLKQIEELLDKYYNAETTLEEERQLSQFFDEGDVPDSLKDEQVKFRFFASALNDGIDAEPDIHLPEDVNTKSRPFPVYKVASGLAAGVLLVVGMNLYFRTNTSTTHPNAKEIKDPQLAYAQTKHALLLISGKLNKGNDQIMKISKLNDIQNSITK